MRVQEIGRFWDYLCENKTWWKAIHMKRFFTCAFTIMEIKNISMWKSFHMDSFWNGGKREFGKGLCNSRKKKETGWEIKVSLFAVWDFGNRGQWYWNFLGKFFQKIELSNFKNAFTIQLKILKVLDAQREQKLLVRKAWKFWYTLKLTSCPFSQKQQCCST